ncbi:LysR family transcriptional regulator [Actinoplanes sp. SE50]|uniref:LysR family transcriptional regulator n=1 Tax=unclassified Actinoplanes TaxID=2626549 RepID=UPI00023ED496|nr:MULTISPECIES: LysR family transcriptional regulator [unclassified Actinoplanes]AEV86165.1 putative RuBisCO transcriptional regulator [Actinoplanes sp. SE50/110]ATO84563.1 LysR family transcriptional regulator [Actinoplanes sp. SE50]SLM01973.1 LysR-family transcriptional regulator [Actinoplanes sp. SE50/110]
MNLELRHLKVVCAIAETGSVTKAASQLGLAQPALTAQLQRIERTLGGPLFDRDRRGARPTALGELVLSRARVLLPAMKGLQDEAARLAAGGGSTMSRYRMGAIGGPVFAHLLHRLSAARPEAQISTYASYYVDELATMVLNGKLDFAQVGVCGDALPSADYGLVWDTIAVDAVCVLMPEDHPQAKGAEVDLGELADEQWSAAAGDGCFETCFATACARAGFAPRRVLEADARACIDMVELGVALGLCQPTFRPPAGLTTRPLKGAPLRWRLILGWHPDSPAARSAPQVLELAREAYQDVINRNAGYVAWSQDHPTVAVA